MLLRTFLEAETSKADRRRTYARIPDKLYWRDPQGKEHRVRELLLSEAIEANTLIQEKVGNYVVEGAKPFVCAREVSPIINVKANAYRHLKGAAGTYAPMVGEGAEIPHANQDYGHVDVPIYKYGVNAAITEEMIEDGLVDAMMLELKYAGEAVENTFNQVLITKLLDGAGNEHDCAGASLGRSAIITAKGLVEADHFRPDTIIMHPEMANIVLKDYATAYTETGEAILQKGMLPTVGGMRPFVCGVADATDSYVWEYNSDTDIGGLVFQKDAASVIAMNRDTTVKEMKDPVHDLINLPVTIRFGAAAVHANAISRIEY